MHGFEKAMFNLGNFAVPFSLDRTMSLDFRSFI